MKKKINILLALLIVLVCTLGNTVPVHGATKQVKLNKTIVTLTVGKTVTLKVENTNQKVKWSSSKKSVATVNSNGKVKAVKAGTAKITAEVSGKKYVCKVTVKNADASAKALEFRNLSGGDFIKGISKATVSFTLEQTSTAVQVYILNEEDKSVYKKTFSKCKADTEYSFDWEGKNMKGTYVEDGNYKALVKAGNVKTTSLEVTFYTTSDFEKGDGSESNPYIVSSITELAAVAKHNGKYFEQSQDLDAEYNSISCLFTNDVPFDGSYDGGGYSIINIINTNAMDYYGIFRAVGEKGSVSNLTVKDSTFSGSSRVGTIVGTNGGTIRNCKVENCQVSASDVFCGALCGSNQKSGKILSCTLSYNTISGNGSAWVANANGNMSSCVGGVCGTNNGIINNCISNDSNVNGSNLYTGGIVGVNAGSIAKCVVKDNTISGLGGVGGVAGTNVSIINNCEVYDNQGLICSSRSYDKAGGIMGRNDGGTNSDNVYYGNLSQIGD